MKTEKLKNETSKRYEVVVHYENMPNSNTGHRVLSNELADVFDIMNRAVTNSLTKRIALIDHKSRAQILFDTKADEFYTD